MKLRTTMFLVHTVDRPVIDPALWGPLGALPGTRSLAGGMATAGSITAPLIWVVESGCWYAADKSSPDLP